MKYLVLLFALSLLGCPAPVPPAPVADASPPASTAPAALDAGDPGAVPIVKSSATASTVSVVNDTDKSTTVFLAFGSNSVVLPSSPGWSFCSGSGLNCSFSLAKHATQHLPLAGQWLNATLSFDKPVTCETTKAEININNPLWYDQLDVSLVDGFNRLVAIDVVGPSAPGQGGVPPDAGSVTLGPPNGATGNERVLGVFPNGCTLCVERQNPPCGKKSGTDGCKKGSQYNPDIVCQWQGAVMGGGDQVTVRLLAGVPAK